MSRDLRSLTPRPPCVGTWMFVSFSRRAASRRRERRCTGSTSRKFPCLAGSRVIYRHSELRSSGFGVLLPQIACSVANTSCRMPLWSMSMFSPMLAVLMAGVATARVGSLAVRGVRTSFITTSQHSRPWLWRKPSSVCRRVSILEGRLLLPTLTTWEWFSA
jgi:hypothetical protein